MSPADDWNDCKQIPSGRFYRCRRADLCLALLRHKQTFQLFGAFDLQVLQGAVKVHGYRFEAGAYNENKFVPICAPYALGPPATLHASSNDTDLNERRLQWRIKEVSDADSAVMGVVNKGDVVLLLRFRVPMAALCARNLYDAALFIPPSSYNVPWVPLDPLCYVLVESRSTLTHKTKRDWLAVVDFLEKERRGKDITSVVMVTGGKNNGKSTCAKFIANSLLIENRPPVYFLDMDVGQSETNPPGCVSLFRVETPLLGVPFSSQRKTLIDSFFYGDISPASNMSLYERLVLRLHDRFTANAFPGSVLVINTPGWVEGEGARLLDRLITKITPDCLFNIVVPGGPNYSVERFKEQLQSEHTLVIDHPKGFIPSGSSPMPFSLTAAALRDLLVMGYMAPVCPSPSLGSLCDAAPYAVPFPRVSIHLHTNLGSLPHTHLLAAINCSLVALCSVNWDDGHIKGERHILNDETMPGVVKGDDLALRCVGFGFVRAVDVERRLFYVLTPVGQRHLGEVNVLSKGSNIDIPATFLNQRTSQEAPYVVCSRNDPSTEMYSELALISCYKKCRKY